MLGALVKQGFEIVNDLALADVAIVNTCGFLESAVRESLDAVLHAASFKSGGRLRKLVVAGCMVERYREELRGSLPEVDAFLTTSELLRAGLVASNEDGGNLNLNGYGRPYFLYDERSPRMLSERGVSAYVKVAEGCNRPCTFCIIPKIRGSFRSRSISSIVAETESLVGSGIREINLVAQDLTAFDSGGELNARQDGLLRLLEALNEIPELKWVRLLYAYPIGVTDSLLRGIVDLPKVCSYLDVPLQHSSEELLKKMKRPIGSLSPRALVRRIKEVAPEIVLRTTFIVGFPGESDRDVDDLVDFVKEGHFNNVGVFTYSPEVGTESYDHPLHVADEVKELRRKEVMQAQAQVVRKINRNQIGERVCVLLEGVHEESDLLLRGRSVFQAPEVDGACIINEVSPTVKIPVAGNFYEGKITGVKGYDLVVKLLREV
jgi:ribosomal protein S12 methylthiotransferase